MRSWLALAPLLLVSACVNIPDNFSQMQLTGRDGGKVYYGAIGRELALVTIKVRIEQRTYSGNLERTGPNGTFGLYAIYGAADAAAKPAAELSRTNYLRAILSSADHRVLRCDFTDYGFTDGRGLCVDEARRVYDVVLN